MRRSTVLAAVSGLALILATPALAQEPQGIAPGQTLEGTIAEGDQATDGVRHDAYSFQARRGERYEAVMTSELFDAYLELYGPDGGDEVIASDDDGVGDGTTNSRLRFTAASDGTYVLRARPLGEDGEGEYTLQLTQRPPAGRAPRPTGIRVGQSREGVLDDRDPETEEGVVYDAYQWRARRGDRVSVSLDSDAFDPVVLLGRVAGGTFEELARNDDGPDSGLNSRLIFTAPDNGDYVIRVTALSAGGNGAYTLGLEEGPEPAAAEAIEIGATVNGELTERDGESASGSRADRYRFSGREGQRVRIEMSSDSFDTYLELLDGAEASLTTDDDGAGDGTNSRITWTLPSNGDYVIEARSFSEGTGDYRLVLSELEPEKAPDALAFATKIEGEIGDTDSEDEESRRFDAYSFSGREGQRVQVIMRSGDFDTYLRIGSADGEFAVLGEDDDGLGEGTDSRLNFTLPSDGEYVLRASPLGSDAEGLYSLELLDRGPQPSAGSVLVGSTARGTLTETDATADDNSFYDAYRVTVRKDEKLRITMVSNEVDSFLMVGKDTDGEFEILTSDDDGLADTHAKLEWTAPDDGTYEIRAGTFAQGQTGEYALTVEKQP